MIKKKFYQKIIASFIILSTRISFKTIYKHSKKGCKDQESIQ